jgi:hypothetical protein
METKQYSSGSVNYNFDRKFRKWTFTSGHYTLVTGCPGGKETADKVAKQVDGANKRVKGKLQVLPGLARVAIEKLTMV